MSKAPAFQLYAADFYMDTVGWPNEAIGAYFRLLMAEWVNGPLPDDHYQLARICQTSVKKFDHFCNYLLPKFVQKGEGYLINERLEKTRELQQQFIENQREKGRKRAKERWAGHIAAAIPRLQPEGQPENASSSSTSIKKESIKKESRKLTLTDEEWLNAIKANPAYKQIDVDSEKGKCAAWCMTNGKVMSRRRLVNWLNRAEKPIGGINGNRPGNIHENGKRPPYGEAGRNGFGSGGTGTPPIYVPEPPPDVSEETVRANLARIKEITGG